MELHVSFFTPRVMSRRPPIRDDSYCGYQGGVQLMSHYPGAKKKLNPINRLFLGFFQARGGGVGNIPQVWW